MMKKQKQKQKQQQNQNQQRLPVHLALSILRTDYLSKIDCANQENIASSSTADLNNNTRNNRASRNIASSSTADLNNNTRNNRASRNILSSILHQNYPVIAAPLKNNIENNETEKAVKAVGMYNASSIYILPQGFRPLIQAGTTHDPYQAAPNLSLINDTNPTPVTPRGQMVSNESSSVVITPDLHQVQTRLMSNRDTLVRTRLNFGS